jgi:hypothetical protein
MSDHDADSDFDDRARTATADLVALPRRIFRVLTGADRRDHDVVVPMPERGDAVQRVWRRMFRHGRVTE